MSPISVAVEYLSPRHCRCAQLLTECTQGNLRGNMFPVGKKFARRHRYYAGGMTCTADIAPFLRSCVDSFVARKIPRERKVSAIGVSRSWSNCDLLDDERSQVYARWDCGDVREKRESKGLKEKPMKRTRERRRKGEEGARRWCTSLSRREEFRRRQRLLRISNARCSVRCATDSRVPRGRPFKRPYVTSWPSRAPGCSAVYWSGRHRCGDRTDLSTRAIPARHRRGQREIRIPKKPPLLMLRLSPSCAHFGERKRSRGVSR